MRTRIRGRIGPPTGPAVARTIPHVIGRPGVLLFALLLLVLLVALGYAIGYLVGRVVL